jgi:hypothetical protein
MPDNKIDNIFKQKIEEITQLPENMAWDKENSWLRLKRKRKQKILSKVYYYAAAILIFGLLLGQLFNISFKQKELKTSVENSFTENEKRQKLNEIEARMSGNYISVKICYTCDYFYYQIVKEKRPVQFRYFENNLN